MDLLTISAEETLLGSDEIDAHFPLSENQEPNPIHGTAAEALGETIVVEADCEPLHASTRVPSPSPMHIEDGNQIEVAVGVLEVDPFSSKGRVQELPTQLVDDLLVLDAVSENIEVQHNQVEAANFKQVTECAPRLEETAAVDPRRVESALDKGHTTGAVPVPTQIVDEVLLSAADRESTVEEGASVLKKSKGGRNRVKIAPSKASEARISDRVRKKKASEEDLVSEVDQKEMGDSENLINENLEKEHVTGRSARRRYPVMGGIQVETPSDRNESGKKSKPSSSKSRKSKRIVQSSNEDNSMVGSDEVEVHAADAPPPPPPVTGEGAPLPDEDSGGGGGAAAGTLSASGGAPIPPPPPPPEGDGASGCVGFRGEESFGSSPIESPRMPAKRLKRANIRVEPEPLPGKRVDNRREAQASDEIFEEPSDTSKLSQPSFTVSDSVSISGGTQSSRSRRASSSPTLRIIFTGIPKEEAMAKKINAEVVDDPRVATHMIVGEELKRTPKLLIAINSGVRYIVHLRWLEDSCKRGKPLDITTLQSKYIVHDKKKEQLWGFEMEHTLSLSRGIGCAGVFAGYRYFYYIDGVTEERVPPSEEMKAIIESGNGMWLNSIHHIGCITGDGEFQRVLVISTKEAISKASEANLTILQQSNGALEGVYSLDFIFLGVLRQRLDLEHDQIDVNSCTENRLMIRDASFEKKLIKRKRDK